MGKKRIHVAAGVIVSKSGDILLALRPQTAHQGGLWEFPGGKVEAGEPVADALTRELQEELAITVTDCVPLIEVSHDYPDKSVLLNVWLVTKFDGEAVGNEGQTVRWVSPEQLSSYDFPAANVPIVEAVEKHFSLLPG